MTSLDPSQRRGEVRFPIEAGPVGFLGSRASGHRSFSYFLRDISEHGAGIFIPSHAAASNLIVGELINFHLPFQINQQFFDQGPVRWLQQSEAGTACGARLEHRIPLQYPVYLSFQTGDIRFEWGAKGFANAGELVQQILEDAYFFKKGVKIYFGHLRPYFARQSRRESQNRDLAALEVAIETSIDGLGSAWGRARNAGQDVEWLTTEELERLRAFMALELDIENLGNAFDSRVVWPFLRSIKLLEHQLYSSFNTLVLLSREGHSNS